MEFLPIKNRDVLIYTSAIVGNSNAKLGLSQFIITSTKTIQTYKNTNSIHVQALKTSEVFYAYYLLIFKRFPLVSLHIVEDPTDIQFTVFVFG